MAKKTLRLSIASNVQLWGLCTALRDYRLAWFINNNLPLELTREADFYTFSHFAHRIKNTDTSFHLLSNRSTEELLLPEKKDFDYFFMVRNGIEPEYTATLISKIKGIGPVLLIQPLDVAKLKTKTVLLAE